jgi:DNA-binding CsgD family transcriptional regulator
MSDVTTVGPRAAAPWATAAIRRNAPPDVGGVPYRAAPPDDLIVPRHQATASPWDALDALEEGLAVHDGPGRQVFANAALRRLAAAGDGLGRAGPAGAAVAPSDPAAQRALRRALAAAAAGAAAELALPRPSGAPPYLLRCAPMPGPGGAGWALLRVADPARRRRAPSAAALRAGFGLTAAEAALAEALCAGGSLAGFAAARGASVHTARTQLRALLAKTRTDRQADLVGLLTALAA